MLRSCCSRPVLALSPLLLANAGLGVGAAVSISTLETSGITVAEAEKVTLIYDTKGKVGTDSFFEAYAKEVIGALCSSAFSQRGQS